MAALVLAAGLASALLARYSPGALIDERELDPRLSAESIAGIRAERESQAGIGAAMARYFRGAARGDLGYSSSRNAPITDLLRSSAPATIREIGMGLAGAWSLGLGMAIVVARFRKIWALDAASGAIAAMFLSVPAALLAYFCLSAGTGSAFVLLLVLSPRVYRFARNLLVQAYGSSHVGVARARGIAEWRILKAHVLPSAASQLFAVGAASLSMAIGAAIPIEAICDSAGLGRLAWQAAIARDLPLLVNLTMLIALATTGAMAVAELAGSGYEARA